MNITVEHAGDDVREAVRHMLQLYLYDFTEFTADDLDDDGQFGYAYLDHYWANDPDDQRFPFLIRAGDRLAGFALVRLKGDTYRLAEFFVLRKYRREGIGQRAACDVFRRFPGQWEIWQIAANLPAQKFWRRVLSDFTNDDYIEEKFSDGVVQRFTCAP